MEEINPYGHHLGDLDPVEVMRDTPARLRALLDGLSPEQIDTRPGPQKWSLREIMAHLADCELVFSWRLRQILGADTPTLVPFDQDRWSAFYAPYPLAAAQSTFEALRAWNLLLLSGISAEDRARSAHHPERGAVTFQSTVENIAGHDLHHLRLLESTRKKEAASAVPSPS